MGIKELLRKTYEYAHESDDRSTKLGAMIWHPEHGMIVRGCNHFIPGYGDAPEHHERPLKYAITEHAERDVIYKSMKVGPIGNCILVCPWVACPDCARAIVLSGLRHVICHKECMDRTPERWRDMVNTGLNILYCGGVEVIHWSGEVGNVENLNNGEIWLP